MYVLPKDADVDFKNEDARHYLSVSSPVDDNGSVIRYGTCRLMLVIANALIITSSDKTCS